MGPDSLLLSQSITTIEHATAGDSRWQTEDESTLSAYFYFKNKLKEKEQKHFSPTLTRVGNL